MLLVCMYAAMLLVCMHAMLLVCMYAMSWNVAHVTNATLLWSTMQQQRTEQAATASPCPSSSNPAAHLQMGVLVMKGRLGLQLTQSGALWAVVPIGRSDHAGFHQLLLLLCQTVC